MCQLQYNNIKNIDNIENIENFKYLLLEHRSYIHRKLNKIRQTQLGSDNTVIAKDNLPPQDYDRALKTSISLVLSNWITNIENILTVLTPANLDNINLDLKSIEQTKKITCNTKFRVKKLDPEAIVDLFYTMRYLEAVKIDLDYLTKANKIDDYINLKYVRPKKDLNIKKIKLYIKTKSNLKLDIKSKARFKFRFKNKLKIYSKSEPLYYIDSAARKKFKHKFKFANMSILQCYNNPTALEISNVIDDLQSQKAKKCGYVITKPQQILALAKLLPLTGMFFSLGYTPDKISQAKYFKKYKTAWCNNLGKVLGVHLRIKNRTPNKQALPQNGFIAVANHPSSFEDAALRAVLDVTCIAKAEVLKWPVFGRIARSMGAIFTNRNGNSKPGEVTDKITELVKSGENVGLFPQGGCRVSTNDILVKNNGVIIDLFPGAFDAAIRAEKPIVVCYWDYSHYHNFAWVGDDNLIKNIKDIMASKYPMAIFEILKIIDTKDFIASHKIKLDDFYNTEQKLNYLRELLQEEVRKIYMQREPGYQAYKGIDNIEAINILPIRSFKSPIKAPITTEQVTV